MRNIIYTEEFGEFYNSLPGRVQTKLLYALNILATLRVVSTKLVKKLVGSDFYELRVSVGNEINKAMDILKKYETKD